MMANMDEISLRTSPQKYKIDSTFQKFVTFTYFWYYEAKGNYYNAVNGVVHLRAAVSICPKDNDL